ncbi:MAG TPA: SPFH domain-containing protein [Actinopolymorphaceae bacterium]|jgi:regulator of protease activity HflC (stomatin/prohibitin superfamily)|nr:SPFH domain-containing protein [Actinopolymorphaceae bacterium]
MGLLIAVIVIAVVAIITLARSIKIIPQARVGIVERLGSYARTLNPGPSLLVPFIDRVRYVIDQREQVVSFPPQNVITEDNLVVAIDTVIYFQVTDAVRATYEIANFVQGIEQLTQTTLRNIVGGMDLERALTSREEINTALGAILDEATGKWGVKVNRVELKGIDPPPSIQDSMEKQMRADRDKRAAVLTAEGVRQSAILTAEGEKQAAILTAEGDKQSQILRAQAQRESQILRAEGEAQAIDTVFSAIHEGRPDQGLLSYQYLQMLPRIAQGDSNKVWIIPSEIGKALEGVGSIVGKLNEDLAVPPGAGDGETTQSTRRKKLVAETEAQTDEALQTAEQEVAQAIAAAEDAAHTTVPRLGKGRPDSPGAPGDAGPDANGDSSSPDDSRPA